MLKGHFKDGKALSNCDFQKGGRVLREAQVEDNSERRRQTVQDRQVYGVRESRAQVN